MSSVGNHAHPACRLLEDNVRKSIRSGIAITSVTQCIEELVLNSIDADASRISVQVDLSEFKLTVEDNGHGIQKNDLEIIGTHYMTSKCHTMSDLLSLKQYGYRGEALASIINVSTGVDIISRSQMGQEAYSRKFIDGVSSGPVRRVSSRKRSSHGVTVTVHGFLAKLPVRQKQISPLEIERLKKTLARIYVMNSRLQIDFKHMEIPILQTPATNSVTDAFQFLYKKVLIEVFSSYDVFYFQAWFSKELHAAKSFQFVYVNNRFTSRNKIHRALDDLIGDVLGVGKKFGPDEGPRGQGQVQGAKYPIFVLNILTPLTEYDITLEPMKNVVEFKNWEQMLKGVETLGCRFKVALQTESRNGLVMDWMKKSELVVEPRPGPSSFGKSISTRTLTSAIHSRFATRVVQQSSPHNLPNSQRESHSDTLGYHEPLGDEDEVQKVYRSHSDPAVQSKMAKFKSPDKPKLRRQPSYPWKSSSQETTVPKKISRRKSKRNADEPLFLKDYNCKRSRTQPSRSYNPDCPDLLTRIQEKFPIFREDDGRTGDGEGYKFEPTTPPMPPPPLPPYQANVEIVHNPLDSPFQRLCLRNGGTIDSEGIWDIPDDAEMPPTSPLEVPDEHFFGVVNDHLNILLTGLNVPDFASESAHFMWLEKMKDQGLREDERGTAPPPELPDHVPSHGGAEAMPRDAERVAESIPLAPASASKSVAEIVQIVMENQRRSNMVHTHPPAPLSNGFQGPQFGANGLGPRIQVPQYWQHSKPMENRIPTLGSQRTTSAECRFEKEDLNRVRVIGQVDNKFIVATSAVNGRESLVIFDQHAVHERIRLETLLDEIRDTGNNKEAVAAQIKRVTISPPLQLELTDTEMRVVNLYSNQFLMMGIQVEIPHTLGNLVCVHSAPLCFAERLANESKSHRDEKIINLIQISIQQQVRHIIETNGNVQLIPQETFNILCTQACHGAIKFGDPLDRDTCNDLITQLALCKAPFQCAHGRPSVTPLLDLTSLPKTQPYSGIHS